MEADLRRRVSKISKMRRVQQIRRIGWNTGNGDGAPLIAMRLKARSAGDVGGETIPGRGGFSPIDFDGGVRHELVDAAVLSVTKEDWCRIVNFYERIEGKAFERSLRCVDPELYAQVEATQNQRAVFLVQRIRNGPRVYSNIVAVRQIGPTPEKQSERLNYSPGKDRQD